MLLTVLTPILIITVILAIFLHRIRQPLVISYILAGILVGPQLLNIIQQPESLEIFSQAGIIFLLFIVGIHLNPQVLKEVGKAALITGLGQVLFTTLLGFGLTQLLGFDTVSSIFIAIALTFSSTIIIMKLIADKKELNELYAKVSIGFLLVQDLAATLILILMPMLSPQNTSANVGIELVKLLSITIILTLLLALSARYLLPKLLSAIANSVELLFLTAITWGLTVASIFVTVGLSVEVGALFAGIALSVSPFAEEISSRLRPLRDFFLVMFFILLGSHLDLSSLTAVLFPSLILSLFVLIGNPLIVYILMRLLQYPRKVSFKAGFTVAQISEFSLILMTSAAALYTISPNAIPLVTLVGIITIAVSTYMIIYSDRLYQLILPLLNKAPLISPIKSTAPTPTKPHIYWFGYSPLKEHLASIFNHLPYQLIIIDYDPSTGDEIANLGLTHVFGDATDTEFLSSLDWTNAKAVISLIPNESVNRVLLRFLSQTHLKDTKIIVTSQFHHRVDDLLRLGAHHVVLPFHLTATHIKKLL
jgi:Kef-type K+ transport system membrane component KefB